MESIEIGHLTQSVAAAIRAAVSEAGTAHGPDLLHGFGLCTDNDVRTLYHVYATKDWASEREASNPEIGLIAAEWLQQSDESEFDAISRQLADWAQSDEQTGPIHPDRGPMIRFRVLFQALKICRDEGLFTPDTFLCVGSTDPDPLMVDLTCAAAPLLNLPEVASAYCAMMKG